MNGRDRFLITLLNGKADRLPCQVHNFMDYWLKAYLKNSDILNAYETVGIDPVIYETPKLNYSEKDLSNWKLEIVNYKNNNNNNNNYGATYIYHTPDGDLTTKKESNEFTTWEIEPMIKCEDDFEIFKKYYPSPISVDWSNVLNAKKMVGDNGIVRQILPMYGQAAPLQSLEVLMGTETTIFKAIDDPDWTHYALKTLQNKAFNMIDVFGKIESDLVEVGGGGASSTVISPEMFKEFCLPYDKEIISAIHKNAGLVSYHLCGGLMPLLEMVVKSGANALETMTPKSMGGDCVMEEAHKRVGDKICFIGGFDQNEGFERNNINFIKKEVRRLFEANPNGGYIISPSDHFFFGDIGTIRLFATEVKKCSY